MKSAVVEKLLSRLDQLSLHEINTLVDKLVKENNRSDIILNALNEGVIMTDDNGGVLFINQAAADLFGVSISSSVNSSIEDVLQGLDWQIFYQERNNTVTRDVEVFYPERKILNLYSTPLLNNERDEEYRRVLLIRDITLSTDENKRNLEDELFNTFSVLAASVAHEIGNPLNSLGIQLQLLNRKLTKLNEPELSQNVEKALNETSRLDQILKDFLKAVRHDPLQRERLSLNTVIEEVLDNMSNEFESRGVKVLLDLEQTLPQLACDHNKIYQAIYNILKNSLQAVDAGSGQVGISSSYNEFEVKVSVHDNGLGIDHNDLGKLFEAFKTTKGDDGNGLGLLIVRKILKEHNGEIEVNSVKGEGTKVTMFFPLGDKKLKYLGNTEDSVIDLGDK